MKTEIQAPYIPDTAPFSPEQRAWLNGFFAGMFSSRASVLQTPNPPAPALIPVTILFGSQTGTAEGLAKRAAKEGGRRGFAATVLDMAQTDLAKLGTERNLLVIVSTYGDGEPPDSAKALHAALAAATAPALASVRYSVCALGDTNYTQFCKCGADFDAFLEKQGASRIHPRAECDLDYEGKFTAWLSAALTAFAGGNTPAGFADAERAVTSPAPTGPVAGHSRSNPFPALVLTSRNLSGTGSAKQINHVEFDLAGSGLSYEAGDALGVYAHNCPEVVAEVLALLKCDGEEAVPAPDGSTTSLRRALAELYELGKPEDLAARAGVVVSPVAFVQALRRLQPRLYSISSSPKAHPGHVHLTVGALRYEVGGQLRRGVCSSFLVDRAVPGETRAGVFIHENRSFRPPADPAAPMIMVGPGTGIAPFRAFLQERRAAGAAGRNWLFFGDQRAATDFIYRGELEEMQSSGHLHRLDLAWSREQAAKVYVQTRMIEQAAELFGWLEAGAHFYVCGDASRMAKDVDAALHTVVERAGGRSPEAAAAYVQALRAAKRYARDVY